MFWKNLITKLRTIINCFFVANLSLFWFFSPYWKHGCKVIFFLGLLWWFLRNLFLYGLQFWKSFFPVNKYSKILYLFLGIVFISFIFSYYPELSCEYFFERYLWYVIAFLWGMSLKYKERVFFFFFGILAGMAFGLGGIIDLFQNKIASDGRLYSSFGFKPDMPTHLIAYLMMGVGLFMCAVKCKFKNFIAAFELFSLLPVFFINQSRVLWLTIIFTFSFVGILKKKILFVFVFLCCFVVILFSLGFKDRFISVFNLNNGGDRLAMWQADIDIIKNNIVFGTGPGTNEIILKSYWSNFQTGNHIHSHQVYLEMGADIGILGLMVFLFFIFILLKDAVLKIKNFCIGTFDDSIFFSMFLLVFAMLIFAFSSTTFIVGVQTSMLFWISIGILSSILIENKEMLSK